VSTAVIGDIHLKSSNKDLIDKFFTKFVPYCIDNDIKRAIFLGDLYNQRSLIRTDLQTLLASHFAALVKSGVDLELVVGNHDLDSLDSKENSLEVFGWLFPKHVRVHSSPTIEEKEIFLPYVHNLASVHVSLGSLNRHTVFCHLPITGFLLAPRMPELSGVPVSWLLNAEKVYAGHFHLRQVKDNIFYIGSLLVNTFAESGMNPCFAVDGNLVEVRSLVPEVPLYFTTEVDGSFDIKSVDWDNNYHKFIIHMPTLQECTEFKDKLMEEARSHKPHSIQFQYVIDKLESGRISENLTPKEMFLQYIDNHLCIKVKKEDAECVKKKGLEYMEKFNVFI
jgi:hypothetical protein